MANIEISHEDVRRFVGSREVDLGMVVPPSGYQIALHAEFDGYGDYLTLVARDVEYVEVLGRFTVGDLVVMPNLTEILGWTGARKWVRRAPTCSGKALVMRDANAGSWEHASPEELYLVVAGTISFLPGSGWRVPPTIERSE
jgi:hypothetical protein